MATMTKREMTEIARKARRHGYYSRSELRGYVICPQCREEVDGYRAIDSKTFRYTTMTRALDEGMLAHLPYCGEE